MTPPSFESGITLILGGVRSGKSGFAEGLACSSGLPLVYVATGEAFDSEMASRIGEHRRRRGSDWELIEERIDLIKALSGRESSCVLVDCLTYWVMNLMRDGLDVSACATELTNFLVSREQSDGGILFVSSEVGLGIVPVDSETRLYRDSVGLLHQSIASVSDSVWFLVAGIPCRIK